SANDVCGNSVDTIGSLKHSSTLTELSAVPNSCDEIELVSLIEEQIPRYKLRADTLTYFSGYDNTDWFIKTPVLDSQEPVDLSPVVIEETLKYFILSAERLSQMTKTYNDIEAVTKLLEEKERDLELAARIGQSLLEQNKELKSRNEELENEIGAANETVTQLKHDIAVKNGLLQIYHADLEKSETESESPNRSPLRDKHTLLLNWDLMHQKICSLEAENILLRSEANARKEDIEYEEKKELQLIHDCAKQLTDANLQLITLQEELQRRTDDNIHQQEEITNLLTQVVELQRKIRELTHENESLQSAIALSHECQNELSAELIDLKEKYATLLAAFHELQDELKARSKNSISHWPPCAYLPVGDSLAAELESEGYESELSSLTKHQRRDPDDTRCHSPDSVLSASSAPRNYRFVHIPPMSNATKPFTIPNKLRIVKPMEGSETLNKWRKLATPHLGVILENHSGVQSRVCKGFSPLIKLPDTKEKSAELSDKAQQNVEMEPPNYFPGKLFDNTASVYTLTTTSLSQSTESTIVTPSFASVQLATGHDLPITSVPTSVTYSGGAQSMAQSSCLSNSKQPPLSELKIVTTVGIKFRV
ncbi:Trafficking kinesin-binding protein 1-like protein, partial [Dinothrombium tinctorium]